MNVEVERSTHTCSQWEFPLYNYYNYRLLSELVSSGRFHRRGEGGGRGRLVSQSNPQPHVCTWSERERDTCTVRDEIINAQSMTEDTAVISSYIVLLNKGW